MVGAPLLPLSDGTSLTNQKPSSLHHIGALSLGSILSFYGLGFWGSAYRVQGHILRMGVVVKIMVPFWVLVIIRHLVFRVPKKGP